MTDPSDGPRRGRGLHRLLDLEVRRDVPTGLAGSFAHEVHPSEIAFDYWTTVDALEAVGHHETFGLNWDPSHFVRQDLDPVGFMWDFRDRIYHVDCKDAKKQVGSGRNGRMGSHLACADPRRGWDFVSTGHGDVPWEASFRMLNTIGFDGPISIEWEDAGMDRLVGAPEALEFVRRLAFDAPSAAFDARFRPSDAPARRRYPRPKGDGLGERMGNSGEQQADQGLIESACAGCGRDVRVRLRSRTVEGPEGRRGAITYADADIAVWDCPDCGFANADAFGE